MLRVVESTVSHGSKRAALFLSAETASNETYVEEQTRYTLKLYNRKNIRDISLNLPEHEHLTFKQLGKPREYRSVVNGQNYAVLEVRYALVANKAGSYAVGPAKMNMTVLESRNQRRKSLFDDPFFSFSSGRPVTVSSKSLEITALPLPETGKPENFSGLVGRFNIESQLEPASVTAGESATLTVRVKGQGNAQRIPDLNFPELADIKIYADQPVLDMELNENGTGGTKTMKWALVPEKQGSIDVPAMTLSFFDPKAKQYKILKSSFHSLSVRPAKKDPTQPSGPAPGIKEPTENGSKQEITELGRDILPIHASMKNLMSQSRIFENRLLFFVMLFGPFFIYMLAFFTLKLKKQQVDALDQTKSKRAAREFAKMCRKEGLSHQDLMDAAREYLNSRFALSLGVLTADEAAAIVRTNGAEPETTEKLRSVVRTLENAVYTGSGHENTDQAEPLSDLIKLMERQIR